MGFGNYFFRGGKDTFFLGCETQKDFFNSGLYLNLYLYFCRVKV